MKLLIVDDQPGVVRGLQQGIDWAAEGFSSQVETAFNALEARAVFRQGAPDVMLCDIEMPVESGLALFEWVRREGHGTRCIFLTSHAEFQYAQEAVRLGATDYIVQPAPYAEVLRVVRRAVDEVRRAQEKDQMVDIGEAFSQEKMTIAAGVQRDFLLGAQDGQYWPTLDRLGCLPVRGVPCHLVLVQVVRWYSLDDRWDGPLMAVALTNIVNEIFVTNSCRAVVSFMEANTFALVLQDREGERQSTEELSRQLLYLNSVCEQYLRCSVACYVETPVFMRQLAKAWPGLLARRDGNVALRSGVFCQPEQEGGGPHHFYQSQVQHWGALLRDGYPQAMEEEAFRLLDELVERGVLDAAALQHLYQDFMWMLYATIDDAKEVLYVLFSRPAELEIYRNGMKSVDQMKALVHHVAVHYSYTPPAEPAEQADIVRQVTAYIDEHLESELRRDELAGHVHLNPDYLTRIFKKETGLTIKEYITRQKMREAQSLLRTTALPVSFIAAKLGYCNFSHFSYTYKKVMGLTPQEERGSAGAP